MINKRIKLNNKNKRYSKYFILIFYILIIISLGLIIYNLTNKPSFQSQELKIINIEDSEKLPGSIEKVAIRANPPDDKQAVALIRLELDNAEVINVEPVKELTLGVCGAGLLFTDNSICVDVADPNKIKAGEVILYAYIRWGQGGQSEIITTSDNGYFNGSLLSHVGERSFADIGGVLPYTGSEDLNKESTVQTLLIVGGLFGISLIVLLVVSRKNKALKRVSMTYGVIFILAMAFGAIYIANNLSQQGAEPIDVFATPWEWDTCINDDQGTANCGGLYEPLLQCGSKNMGVNCEGEPDKCGICVNCDEVWRTNIGGGYWDIECADESTSTDPCVTEDHRWGYYYCNGRQTFSCDDWTVVDGSNIICNTGQECLSGMGCVGGDQYSIYSSTDYCSALSTSNMTTGQSQSIRGAMNSATKTRLRELMASLSGGERIYLVISAVRKSNVALNNVTINLINIPPTQWLPTMTEDGLAYIDITDKLQNLSYEHDVSYSMSFIPTLAASDRSVSFVTSLKVGLYNTATKTIDNINDRRVNMFSCFSLTFNNSAVTSTPTNTNSPTATARATNTATPRVTVTATRTLTPTPRATVTVTPQVSTPTVTPTRSSTSPTPTTPAGQMSCGQTGCKKDSECETGLPNYECDETSDQSRWPQDNVCVKVCTQNQTRIDSCTCQDIDPNSVACGPVDVNGDNLLNYIDLAAFSAVYNKKCNDSPFTGGGCGGKDNNGDSLINYIDLGFFSSHYYPKAQTCLP
jgi:hypothetical protein